VLSAYVQPVAERYLTRLSSGLRAGGFDGQAVHHAVEIAGSTRSRKTKEIPITMVEVRGRRAASGGGRPELGRLIAEPKTSSHSTSVGTTAKCSLIEGGAREDHDRLLIGIVELARRRGYPRSMVPGRRSRRDRERRAASIALGLDDFGKLRVGAPSLPARCHGPRARVRGRGGTEADDDRLPNLEPRPPSTRTSLLLRAARIDADMAGRG